MSDAPKTAPTTPSQTTTPVQQAAPQAAVKPSQDKPVETPKR